MDLSGLPIDGTNFDPVACAASAKSKLNIRLNLNVRQHGLLSGSAKVAVPLPPHVYKDHHIVNPGQKRPKDEPTGYQKGSAPKMKCPNPNEPGLTVGMVMVNNVPYLPAAPSTPTHLMQSAGPSPVAILTKQNQVDTAGGDQALVPPSPVSSSSSSSPPRIQLVATEKKRKLGLQKLKYCNPSKYIEIPAPKNQGTKAARRQSRGMSVKQRLLKTKKK